tara:strand:+ start:183 stop:1466 length:1284 start_codon:yes stop_codon:yes gene_type:complete
VNNNFLKKIIQNSLLLLSTIFILLFIFNFILIHFSHKQKIPRQLAGSLPNYYFSFYPDTYEKDKLKKYTAILGDSLAQGSGDGYLSSKYDYSFAHHLHNMTGLNFLNFARGGYGSISSVSNFERILKMSKNSFFQSSLEIPKKFIFFFSEGNDLTDNFDHYTELQSAISVKEYVNSQIEKNLKDSDKKIIEQNIPIIFFFKKIIFNDLIRYIKKIDNYSSFVVETTKIFNKISGHTVSLSQDEINALDLNKFKNFERKVQPLESAANELNSKEILISLEIFFESINYLNNKYKDSEIIVIYLPSPVSSYEWEEPITIWSNYISKNKLGFLKTSNEQNNYNRKFITENILEFCNKKNFQFLDVSEFVRNKGNQNLIHGPIDMEHFNHYGYKIVSKYIFDNIKLKLKYSKNISYWINKDKTSSGLDKQF